MTKVTATTDKQAQWVKPELTSLDLDLTDVKNGYNIGNDGAGGVTTSLS